MAAQVFRLAQSEEKTIEKVIFDENIHYLHLILPPKDKLPEHFSNATIYMTVVKGRLSIGLGSQNILDYDAGTLLKIPYNTKMNILNLHNEALELIIVKAPAPKN